MHLLFVSFIIPVQSIICSVFLQVRQQNLIWHCYVCVSCQLKSDVILAPIHTFVLLFVHLV